MSAITCAHLQKAYGETVVIQDFNLEIADGEFVVFLGPSGCGKSTLLRMLAGLEDISGGDLILDGMRVNDLEPSARGVAMVFQNYALYPHMTIFDNIAFGLRRQRVPVVEIKQRVDLVAKMLHLEAYLDRMPAQLSGGQQQRVAIARAMIKTPKLFLFDEPLSNLDAKLRHHMRNEIAGLHRSLKATTVYVTHDQLEAMTLADRIVLMRDGRIEQVGTPQQLYNAPANRFVADFIGTPGMNFVTCAVANENGNLTLSTGGVRGKILSNGFSLPRGREVVVGVRPQDLTLGMKAPAISCTGTVESVEFLGDSQLVNLRLSEGKEISALVDVGERVQIGDEITFGASTDAVHLFEPESDASLKRY